MSAYKGPAKFTPEEVAMGNKGIRWVTQTQVAGRPTAHDVREYLLARGDAAACSCDECRAFYAAAQGGQQPQALRATPMTDLEQSLLAALRGLTEAVERDDNEEIAKWSLIARTMLNEINATNQRSDET